MSFVSMTKPTLGDATKKSFADQLIDNDDALNSSIGEMTLGIVNGSFEIGVDPDAPTGWVFGTTWGTKGFDTATPGHGAKAFKFASAGSGGGELQSEGFIGCDEGRPVVLSFLHKSSAAGLHNLVELLWYDAAQSYLSTTAIYDDTATNPTSWTAFLRTATAPAGARYFKVKITGAKNDDATVGTAYFDGVELVRSQVLPFSGTIAEDTETATSWTDNGSVAITLPVLQNAPVVLCFVASLKATTAGQIAAQRFRVGTDYSTEWSVDYDTEGGDYLPKIYTLFIPQCAGGALTLYQQLKTTSGGTTYGKKDVGNILATIGI